jgi:hypothetical protein
MCLRVSHIAMQARVEIQGWRLEVGLTLVSETTISTGRTTMFSQMVVLQTI